MEKIDKSHRNVSVNHTPSYKCIKHTHISYCLYYKNKYSLSNKFTMTFISTISVGSIVQRTRSRAGDNTRARQNKWRLFPNRMASRYPASTRSILRYCYIVSAGLYRMSLEYCESPSFR